MDVTKQNIATLNRGIGIALRAAKSEFLKLGLSVAEGLIGDALDAYPLDKTLTGNILNSIAGGVYINKKLEGMIFASDKGVEPATSTYARVGDRGFVTWTGEQLKDGYVHQYKSESGFKFQSVGYNVNGEYSAMTFLRSYRPKTQYLEVVICAAAPYAEYLQNVRKLDVLTTAYSETENRWNFNVLNVKKIKL